MLADELGVTEGFTRDWRDKATALRKDADEIDVSKLDQRLANRRPADAETIAKVQLRHRRTGRQRAAYDLIEQPRVDLIGQPPARLLGNASFHVGRLIHVPRPKACLHDPILAASAGCLSISAEHAIRAGSQKT